MWELAVDEILEIAFGEVSEKVNLSEYEKLLLRLDYGSKIPLDTFFALLDACGLCFDKDLDGIVTDMMFAINEFYDGYDIYTLADEVGVSYNTIRNLFKKKHILAHNFFKIAEGLYIDLTLYQK